MIEYTREEALNLTDLLIKKLSTQVDAFIDKNIGDSDKLETSMYMQQSGKEFISLVDKKNIKNELAEYDNQTIAMVLSNILPSAIVFELEKNLSEDFCIVDTQYETTSFILPKQNAPDNPKAGWTMQNADWGDKWRYISEEEIKQKNDKLTAALKDFGFSDDKISSFLETEDPTESSMKSLTDSLQSSINDKSEEINEAKDEIKKIKKEIKEIRSNKTRSEQDRRELLKRRNALLAYKSIQLERLESESEELKSKINNINSLLYDKIYKSGCKIVSMAKILAAMYGNDTITPDIIMQYVDKDGMLSDESLKAVYPDYKVTTVQEKEIANYVFPEDCYIIGHARIGGGLGEHFVVITRITSTVKNGKVILEYEKSNSSDNDEKREYSSEDPGTNPKKAKVLELRVFERIKK